MEKLLEYLYGPKKSYTLLTDQVGRIEKRIKLLKEKNINGSNNQEIERLESVLNNYTIAQINYESIGIGTCFTITEFQLGKRKTNKYQLVDFLETLNNHYDETGEYQRICLDTPVGQAIYGKKVGDPFSYIRHLTVAGINQEIINVDALIVGTIEGIKTTAKEISKQI